MPQLPINVYTADRSVPQFLTFCHLLAESLGEPVYLHPLSALPAPDLTRRQQKRAELVGLRAQLSTLLYLIRVGENNPKRYGCLLNGLRAERDAYALRIDQLERQLNAQQKGGAPLA